MAPKVPDEKTTVMEEIRMETSSPFSASATSAAPFSSSSMAGESDGTISIFFLSSLFFFYFAKEEKQPFAVAIAVQPETIKMVIWQ